MSLIPKMCAIPQLLLVSTTVTTAAKIGNILRGTTYDGACAPTHIHLTERIKDVKKGMKSYTVYAEVHMMIINNNIIL